MQELLHLALAHRAVQEMPALSNGRPKHQQLRAAGVTTSRGKPHTRQSAHRLADRLESLSPFEADVLEAIGKVLDANAIYDSASLDSILKS